MQERTIQCKKGLWNAIRHCTFPPAIPKLETDGLWTVQ